jgi:hypothetical protein
VFKGVEIVTNRFMHGMPLFKVTWCSSVCNASNSPSSYLILRWECNVVLEEINVDPRSRDKEKEKDFVAIARVTSLIIARAGIFVD